jgi:hypothetical protein
MVSKFLQTTILLAGNVSLVLTNNNEATLVKSEFFNDSQTMDRLP